MFRHLTRFLGLALLAGSMAGAATTSTLRLLTFNIVAGGNAISEIGASSPLYQQARHADIAAVIIQADADIVGVLEPAGGATDPILTVLQADDPAWRKRGNLYAKSPIEEDPRNPGDQATHLVRTGPEQFVICHVAHWKPSNYGPFYVQSRIIADTIPADPNQFDSEVVAAVRKDSNYQGTLAKVQPHLDAGRPVFVLGDFNEASHLDWTAGYAANGADRWVANPSGTPLRFKVTWPGSSLLLGAGLKDSYRTIFPDPVARPGNTWTPPYANTTPGRRPYDGNTNPDSGSPNQVTDRIDWLLFAGHGVTATAAAVVGENPANPEHRNKSEIIPEIQYAGSWPSDHRAVLGTFTLPLVTGPKIPDTPSSGLPARESDDLVGRIDQIEGDVDPATLDDWAADLGGFAGQFIQNTDTFTVSLDTAAYDRWAHFGDLNGDTGWTIELNIRIDSVGDPGGDVGVFDVVSRTNLGSERSPWFYLRPDGIGVRPGALATEPPLIAANLNDGRFHKIRMATMAGEGHTIWIDGVLAGRWTENDFNADPAVFLGRNGGNTVDDGTTTIDYIRFDTTGAWSPPGSGSSDSDPPPSPADGASIDRSQPLYWWPVAGAVAYRVWFGPSDSLTAADFQGEFTNNYFDPGLLLENTTYHWQVDVVTSGATIAGVPASFTTGSGSDLVPRESYEGWRLTHFSTATLLDPAKESTHWGDNVDHDHDGLSTMLECAVGGDPFVPDPGKLPQVDFEAGLPVVSFRQRGGATGTPGIDSVAWGIASRIEVSPDLVAWSHGAQWLESVGSPVDHNDGTETVRVRLHDFDPGLWFVRLGVFKAGL